MTDLLIDGNSLFARAWFATMRSNEGDATEAIRAGLTTVFALLDVNKDKLGEKVDRILIGWDGANKRDKGRDPKPAEYHDTREILIEYLQLLLNPMQVCLKDAEADDVVATAVAQSDADTIFVVSGDKDLQQLAGNSVHYYCLNTKGVLSPRSICDKWGVKHPSQVAIALAIIGDKVDCINGVKGWGPKKVRKLFETASADMTLEEAARHVESQMVESLPPAALESFYSDLDMTLLHSDLRGVSPPNPVLVAQPDVVEELRLPKFMEYYRPVYRLYSGNIRIDAAGDEEDVP